jgi:hypothetical protein
MFSLSQPRGLQFENGNDQSDHNEAEGRHYQGHPEHWVVSPS